MKNLQTLFVILTGALFFTACQKDEAPVNYDSISGQLTAGENVTADELIGVDLALCQYRTNDDINSSYDIIDMTVLDELGEFEFTNMSPGNYFIGLNEFIFIADSVYSFYFDGTEALSIKQTINRNPAENIISPYPPCAPPKWVHLDMKNYSGPDLTFIKSYGYYFLSAESAIIDLDFEAIDGIIKIERPIAVLSYCTNSDTFMKTHFVFGFADGNGGTLYSEKFECKYYDSDGSCQGLPQTIGQTTISFESGKGYVLTNN